MSLETFDGFRDALIASGVGRAAAERFAHARFGGPTIETASDAELQEEIEEAHVTEGVRLMRALGFTVVMFSQKKRAKVTPGIPDWKFYHRGRHLTLWWEAKAEWGRARPRSAISTRWRVTAERSSSLASWKS
jgi:hypothetical protein